MTYVMTHDPGLLIPGGVLPPPAGRGPPNHGRLILPLAGDRVRGDLPDSLQRRPL